MPLIDANQLTYTHTTADPVSTCHLALIDNTSSLSVSRLQEVLILDEKVYPNPTANLVQNPQFNPYNTSWTVNAPSGLTFTQINQSTANLTLYLTSASSGVYGGNADQLYSFSGTPTTTSFATVIGNNVTGWGEIVNRTGSPPYIYAGASSLPAAPTGRGWLFDRGTFLQGETLQAGAYIPTFRFQATQAGAGAGTLKGDFVCRLWKWNSVTTTFTLIVSSSLTNQTVNSTATSYTFQQGYGASVALDVADYLYLDLWFNCKTNVNGASNQAITISNLSTDTSGHTGDANAQLVTPGAIVPAAVAFNINAVSTGIYYVLQQYTLAGQIVPGQQYLLSAYWTWGSPDNNTKGFVQIDWYDASKTHISNAFFFGPAPGVTPLTRYQIASTAPASATYAQVSIGIQTLSNTNAATVTIENVMLEPMWFSDISYPTPFAGPNQPNCQQLGNSGLWVRQYRKFGGLVNHVLYKNYHGNVRTIQVSAVGFAWLMSLVNAADTFAANLDSAIFKSLLSTYFGSLFNTSQIVDGVTISNLFCNWDDLRTIFDGLAAQAAYFWTVDSYWSALYQPPGYTALPFSLICDNSVTPNMSTTYPAFNFQAEMDYTQPGSNILVIGGTPAGTTLTAALTSGTHYTSLSVVALQEALPANLICSLSGTQGITLSADANAGDTTINIFNFLALTDYAKGSSISPQPLCARVLDPAAIQTVKQNNLYSQGLVTSLLMRKINDTTLQSLPDCNQRGLAELIQYDAERYIYHLTTNVELIAGQSVPVTSNTDNLSATTLLVQQVTATWKGVDGTMTDVWEYAADLGAVNRAASTILSHIFRRTNTNSSSPAIIQTSLVAMERIGIADSPPLQYAQLVLAGSPIGYFRLGETSDNNSVDDYTLNGGNGLYHGGATQGVPGLIYLDPNGAVLLDGATGYATTALTLTTYITNALSVVVWFELSGVSFTAAALVADSNSPTSGVGMQVLLTGGGTGIEFDLGGIGSLTVSGLTLTAGITYMLSCKYDGATMTATLFSPSYPSGQAFSRAGSGASLAASGHTVNIGWNPATSSLFIPATVDEVSFNNYALTAATEMTLYSVGAFGRLPFSTPSSGTSTTGTYGSAIYGTSIYG